MSMVTLTVWSIFICFCALACLWGFRRDAFGWAVVAFIFAIIFAGYSVGELAQLQAAMQRPSMEIDFSTPLELIIGIAFVAWRLPKWVQYGGH